MSPEGIIYVLLATSYISYFSLVFLYSKMGNSNLIDTMGSSRKIHMLNARHASGIFLFGIIFAIAAPQFHGLINASGLMGFAEISRIGILGVMCMLLSLLMVRRKAWDTRASEWIRKTDAIGYIGVRLVFLLAYEYFFRGVLFLTVLHDFGLVAALFANAVLYAGIHSFESRAEILGCVLFGPALCLLVYSHQSIWPAFILHACLTLPYEISLLRKFTLKPRYI